MLSHFIATDMRLQSTFDPAGFMFVGTASLLCSGLIATLFMRVVFPQWIQDQAREAKSSMEMARQTMEKNIQGVSKYVADLTTEHSARQGFVVEMLSFEYLSRLGFALFMFAITSYLNALAAVIAGWRTPNVIILNLESQDNGEKTLPDLGHDLFKYSMSFLYGDTDYIDWFELPDEFIYAVGTCTMLFLVFHPRRLLILRRVMSIFAWINLLRACCVAVTSLPDASPMCISQFNTDRGLYKSTPIFPRAFFRAWKVLIRPSQHITCGDMIFSGHTVFLVLCGMIVHTYCRRSELNTPFTRRFPFVLNLIRAVIYVGIGLGVFAIVGTRLHYTLDVLIATGVTIHSWLVYHWLAGHCVHENALIGWLENDDVAHIDHFAYRIARRTGSFELTKDKTS